jgi:hypothetical protein
MELIESDSYGRPTDILRQRTISVYEIDEDPELNSNWAVLIISILALVVFIGIILCLLL